MLFLLVLSHFYGHGRAEALAAGCPDAPAVVFHDLLDDRKADAAAAGRGIPRGIRPVEAVEDEGNVLAGNALAVVFDLDLNEILSVLHADVDGLFRLIHIFDGVGNDVVDDAL